MSSNDREVIMIVKMCWGRGMGRGKNAFNMQVVWF